jgi:hypothetical protein
MPSLTRQRLKPFAPRIAGTRDGLDAVRTELLRRALTEEVLPRIPLHRSYEMDGGPRRGGLARLWARLNGREETKRRLGRLMERVKHDAHRRSSGIPLAGSLVEIISISARLTSSPCDERWWWDCAIGVLDRICDVGAERRLGPSRVRLERVAWLERSLHVAPEGGAAS